MAKRKIDRLSRDAAAAKAASMSYGKWKALQLPDKPAPPPKPKNTIEVKCQWCGKTFYQTDKRHRKYCEDCRDEASLEVIKAGNARWKAEHREYMKEYSKKWRAQNAVYKV